MPRAQSSVPHHKKHRKMIKMAKGYYGARHSVYTSAKDAVEKALQYSYRDRRQRKRDFRRLWISRINAGARQHGLSYSVFIKGLHDQGIKINRKILADMAVHDAEGFAELVKKVKS